LRNSPYWSGSLQLDIDGNTALDNEVSPANANVIIGQYFEYLTSRIFDGKLADKPDDAVFPDVVLWGRHKKGDILLEVKGTYRAPLMSLFQLQEYKKLEDNDFPFTRPRVYYVIYLHSAIQIVPQCPTVRDLLAYLSKSIDACIVVPIDALIRLVTCNNGLVYDFGQWQARHQEDTEKKYVRWTKQLDKILRLGDRFALRDFLDLTTLRGCGKIDQFADYRFRQQTVSGVFVQRFKVNDFRVVSMYRADDWKGSIQ
jgi:hypothetical protein